MRLEVPFTAGEHAVLVTLWSMGFTSTWHHTWSYRASEAIAGTKSEAGLTKAVNAEGDALFGSGGLVHVRIEGEAPPP